MSSEQQHRALIIQPGALGDSLLILPLVTMLKTQTPVESVEVMGRLDYIDFLPKRSEVDAVLALEGVAGLHQLFVPSEQFDLPDEDPLITFFSRYDFIVTFLTDEKGHFERNLIMVTMMHRGAEIATVPLMPPADYANSVSRFWMEQVIAEMPQWDMVVNRRSLQPPMITLTDDDRQQGRERLERAGAELERPMVVMHPGSGGEKKCWPIEYYLMLAQALRRKGYEVVTLLGPTELERWSAATLDALERESVVLSDLSLLDIAAVIMEGHAYLGNDSGISHLAGLLGQRGLVIFGPTNPAHWAPLGTEIGVLSGQQTSSLEKSVVWPEVKTVEKGLHRLIEGANERN